jgi:hypothetical protein
VSLENKQKLAELETLNEKLKSDNQHLKDEYEKYKIRTNYLIKSAKQQQQQQQQQVTLQSQQSSESDQQQELQCQKLRDECETLRKRVQFIEREKLSEAEALSKHYLTKQNELRNDFKSQVERIQSEQAKVYSDLEKELVKQRERTVKLIAEKDAELESLKNSVRKIRSGSLEVPNSAMTKSLSGSLKDEGDSKSIQESPADSLNHVESVSQHETVTNSISNNSMLLYYNQQNAYKDTELNKLRLAYKDLEYRLKHVVDENSVDLERLQAQSKLLKEEIERLKLNHSRAEMDSSENLEYIKNVVFQYMTSKDQTVRANMIVAIMQILQFTRSEKQKMQSLIGK